MADVFADVTYGFNVSDSTTQFYNAIDSEKGSGNTLIFRDMGSPWLIGAQYRIFDAYDLDIVFEPGCVVRKKQRSEGGFWEDSDYAGSDGIRRYIGISNMIANYPGGTNGTHYYSEPRDNANGSLLWFTRPNNLNITAYGAEFIGVYPYDNPGTNPATSPNARDFSYEFGAGIMFDQPGNTFAGAGNSTPGGCTLKGGYWHNFSGDGVLVSDVRPGGGVAIEDVKAWYNKRIGIAHIHGNDFVFINDCDVSFNGKADVAPVWGTNTRQGITIEPNNDDETVLASYSNIRAVGNSSCGLGMNMGTVDNTAPQNINIFVDGLHLDGNSDQLDWSPGSGIRWNGPDLFGAANGDNPLDGSVGLVNIALWGDTEGFMYYRGYNGTPSFTISGAVIYKPSVTGTELHTANKAINWWNGVSNFVSGGKKYENFNWAEVLALTDKNMPFIDIDNESQYNEVASTVTGTVTYVSPYTGNLISTGLTDNSTITENRYTIASFPQNQVSVTRLKDAVKVPVEFGQFLFSRTGSTAWPMAVHYEVSTNGVNCEEMIDFKLLRGSVIIPAGVSTTILAVRPMNPDRTGVGRDVTVTIQPAPDLYTIGTAAATLDLLDAPAAGSVAVITGTQEVWHPIRFEYTSTASYSETGSPNPFLDRRLYIDFVGPSAQTYRVHGYFAADGNAAETSANSGNKWHVMFSPDEAGTWSYTTSFRSGSDIAIEYPLNVSSGSTLDFNGDSGSFIVAASSKSAPDFRARGRLVYDGTRYLKTQGDGKVFIKCGADSPETALAYSDFDNTSTAGSALKTWGPHIADWQSGDPQWQGTKGRGIIGMLNYLAAAGANAWSFLPMNVIGDGKNVWPYQSTSHSNLDGSGAPDTFNRTYFDVSKLEQWRIVFEHAQSKGIFSHFKTQETENDQLLDAGQLGQQRKVYYKELIARFGHILALNWNFGEEYDIGAELGDPTQEIMKSYCAFVNEYDPYTHHRVLHTYPGQQDLVYDPLLGVNPGLTGLSLQTPFDNVKAETLKWVIDSGNAGKQWAVACDEVGPFQRGVAEDAAYGPNTIHADNRDDIRKNTLWGNLMSGGWGVEYYYGYETNETDLDAEDQRSRATKWADGKNAIDFFANIDLPNFTPNDSLATGTNNWCLANAGNMYIVYLRDGDTSTVTTTGSEPYTVQWYDPRNGGAYQDGTVTSVSPGSQSIGLAPNNTSEDWVVILTAGVSGPQAGEVKVKANKVGAATASARIGSTLSVKGYIV